MKSKPRISRRDSRHLQKLMHFPALSAIRTDEKIRGIFLRIISRAWYQIEGKSGYSTNPLRVELYLIEKRFILNLRILWSDFCTS
uniref:hypothetical protein n=1 Tax=Sphingobacterium endophyticum TaxID=2546448 RepID=UPI0018CCB5E0|nr:hypothetical protein [Sphingobacterium endophyticum]